MVVYEMSVCEMYVLKCLLIKCPSMKYLSMKCLSIKSLSMKCLAMKCFSMNCTNVLICPKKLQIFKKNLKDTLQESCTIKKHFFTRRRKSYFFFDSPCMWRKIVWIVEITDHDLLIRLLLLRFTLLITSCLQNVWSMKRLFYQGCNERKVISEVYTSFVLQCTVSGG